MTMHFKPPTRWFAVLRTVALTCWMIALAGCDSGQVRSQRVPKESADAQSGHPVSPHGGSMDFHAGTSAAQARPKWTLPEGWKEVPPISEMRVANFISVGKSGQTNDISVIPMASGTPEGDLVLMWRQQMQLPMNGQGGGQESEPIAIGSDQGKLFDIVSDQPILEGNLRARLIVAMVPHGAQTWFFKMSGEESSVREQKPVFVEFVKSVDFSGDAAPGLLNMPVISDAGAKPNADLPADWKEVPPPQFVTVKYVATGADDARAEVSVSVLGGDGGGPLENVNRWRGQLSLPRISDADLAAQVKSVETARGKAMVVDMTGTDKAGKKARIIGVVLLQTGKASFYKLVGDPAVVEAQTAAFTKFVQAAKY